MDAIDAATGASKNSASFPKPSGRSNCQTKREQNDFLDIFGRSRRDTPCVCETHIEPNLSQVLYMMFSPELETAIASPQGNVVAMDERKKPTADMVARECICRRFRARRQPMN